MAAEYFEPGLVKFELSSEQVRPGDTLLATFVLANHGGAPSAERLKLFFHVEYPKPTCENIVLHYDHWPAVPTTVWQAGFVYSEDPMELKVPAKAPEGRYYVHLGLYDPASGKRYLDVRPASFEVTKTAPPAPEPNPQKVQEAQVQAARDRLASAFSDPPLLEGKTFTFKLDKRTGAYQLHDKRTGVNWYSAPALDRFGTVYLRTPEGSATVKLTAPEIAESSASAVVLRFLPEIENLTGPAIEVKVSVRETPLEGLHWEVKTEARPGFAVEQVNLLDSACWASNADAGYAVLPDRMGRLLFAAEGAPVTSRHTPYTRGCNMLMFGMVKQDSALLVSWDNPYSHLEMRRTWQVEGAPGTALVEPTLALEQSARSLDLFLLGKGDYVTCARAYRDIAKAKGFLVTFKEKLAANPKEKLLFGAVDFKPFVYTHLVPHTKYNPTDEPKERVTYTFAEAAENAEHLHEVLGIDRALYVLAGWIHKGYDNQHPDILPAAEPCGGDAGLAECARRVKRCGFLFGLHDNYQDMYPDAPSFNFKYIIKDKQGKPHLGGEWAGGRCYLVCSEKSLELAQRPQNLPAVKHLFDPDCYFIDTVFAAPLYECYDPEHQIDKLGDLHWKSKLCDYARQTFGCFGSEEGFEWGVPHAEYFEGILSSVTQAERRPGEARVPLFELVYGDAIQLFTHQGDRAYPGRPDYIAECVLNAELPVYNFGPHLYFKQAKQLPLEAVGAEVKPLGPYKFEITYLWRTQRRPAKQLRAFVHFVNYDQSKHEGIVFQDDHSPKPPATEWQASWCATGRGWSRCPRARTGASKSLPGC